MNRRTSKTCYMCDQTASSREHVPPKCLFPEHVDGLGGHNHREQLITVPSCALHNTGKSNDDEFLLYTLAMNLASNDLARAIYETRVKRSMAHSQGLIKRLLHKTAPVFVHDAHSKQLASTFAYVTDTPRLLRVLEQIGRALYFHIFGERWTQDVVVLPEFIMKMDSVGARQSNDDAALGFQQIAAAFSRAQLRGGNPGVFQYQVITLHTKREWYMRLYFYQGSVVNIHHKYSLE